MEYPFKDLLPLDEVLEREGYYKDWTHLDPEVFYSLTQISEYIKTKGYGVDVRLLIAQLAEHFGLKTTQVVDLGNLIQAEHATLKQQVQQAVAQVNADRNALETKFNQSVAQMEADKNAVIANATVDSEVILARGGKPTLGARLDETTAQLAQNMNDLEQRGVNVKLNGAVGDGISDDTVAIQNLFDSANIGDTVIIPKGKFKTTSTLYVRKEITVLGDQAEIYCDHDSTGIKVERAGGVLGTSKVNQVKLNISVTRKTRSKNTVAVGIDIVDVFRGVFNIPRLENHGIGMLWSGITSGMTYSQFYLGFIIDCYVGIKTYTTNGYVTENTVYGGNFGSGLVNNIEDAYACVWIDNPTNKIVNNNKFFSSSFEGFYKNGVVINMGQSNHFYSCRFEMPHAEYYINLIDASVTQDNTFTDCYGLAGGLKNGKIFDEGPKNRIIGSQFPVGSFLYTERNVFLFNKPGEGKQEGFNSNLTVKSMWSTTKRITANTSSLTLDFSTSDHFEVVCVAGVDITSITFVNLPPVGTIASLSFVQSASGNNISGFSAVFLGKNAKRPTKKANGRDVYLITRGNSSLSEIYALAHYKQDDNTSPSAYMPTIGEFVKGDYVPRASAYLVEEGTAGNKYIIYGWLRMTTGSNHVLGTDWIPDRHPTGN